MNPSRFTNFSFIRINTSLNSAVNPLTISRLEAFQLSTLDMIQAKNPDATILVVSHGIFIRDMLTRVGGFSYDDFWKLPVGNCSIAVLSYDGKQLKIEEMGEKVTEWLV